MDDTDEVEVKNSHVFLKEFTAGGISGIAGIIVGHPIDTIKTNMQNAKGQYSQKDVFKQIKGINSSLAFFRGLSTPILSYAFVNAVSFGTFKPIQNWLDPDGKSIPAVFVAGCFAGAAQAIVLVPSDLIKVRMQVTAVEIDSTNRTFLGCTRGIIREKGFIRGFYNGALITGIRDVPAFGIYFSCYYLSREFLCDVMNGRLFASAFVAGGFAGIVSWVLTLPFDIIKTRIQTGKSKNIMDCVHSLKPFGVGVYFTGAKVICLRAAVANSVTFAVYDKLITMLNYQ